MEKFSFTITQNKKMKRCRNTVILISTVDSYNLLPSIHIKKLFSLQLFNFDSWQNENVHFSMINALHDNIDGCVLK